MRTPNEFWLCLHELARAAEAEGCTDEERRRNIATSLGEMPSMARSEVLAELAELMVFLPDLYPHIVTNGDDLSLPEGSSSAGKLHENPHDGRTVA